MITGIEINTRKVWVFPRNTQGHSGIFYFMERVSDWLVTCGDKSHPEGIAQCISENDDDIRLKDKKEKVVEGL